MLQRNFNLLQTLLLQVAVSITLPKQTVASIFSEACLGSFHVLTVFKHFGTMINIAIFLAPRCYSKTTALPHASLSHLVRSKSAHIN